MGGVRAWTGFRVQTLYIALRVAEWLPQRSAVHGQRYKAQNGCADRDHHRPQSHDAGIQQRFA